MKKRTDEDSAFVRTRGVVESVADEIRKMTGYPKKKRRSAKRRRTTGTHS